MFNKTRSYLTMLALLLVVAALAFFVYPSAAQDELTPDVVATEAISDVQPPAASVQPDPTDDRWVMIFLGLFTLLFAFMVLVVRPLAVQLGKSAPATVIDGVIAAQERFFRQMQDWAAKTTTKADDAVLEAARSEARKIVNAVRVARGEEPAYPEG